MAAGALALFALAHALAAWSPSFWLVASTRLLSGAMFGLYLAVAFQMATRLASPSRRGRAMGLVQSGITASTALGIPAGLALGRAGGDAAGWRLPFLVIAGLALVAAATIAVSARGLPPDRSRTASFTDRLAVLRRPPVILGLTATAVFWGGSFGGLTHVVSYLEEEVGLGLTTVIIGLVVVGALSVAGNVVGGLAADGAPAAALVITSVGAVVGLSLLFGFTASAALALVGLALWQLSTWAFVPVIQARVHTLGQEQGPAAVSYAVAAFNLGIVVGSALGGLLLDSSGFRAVGLLSLALASVAVLVSVAVNRTAARPGAADRADCHESGHLA